MTCSIKGRKRSCNKIDQKGAFTLIGCSRLVAHYHCVIVVLQTSVVEFYFFDHNFTSWSQDFFTTNLLFPISIWTFISLFSLDFYFPFSLWTFISLFSTFIYLISQDFYFPFLFGLLFSLFSLEFYFLFISLFSLDFHFPFSLWTFIQSRSHFGFLPNFLSLHCVTD